MIGPSGAPTRGGRERPAAPFIVGVGRSGTTLLRMMLDAHPLLAVTPETHFAPAVGAFERGGPRAAVGAIVGDGLWEDYNLPAEEFARRVEAQRASTLGDVLRTFYELYAERQGKSLWGDKTPDYLTAMAVVQEHLSEARFIHVLRDGRDVALSMVPLWFGADDVAAVARMWSRRLAEARRQASELAFYTEVRYEDLVREPKAALLGLCDFLELDWNPAMLDYHRRAAARIAAESPPVHQEGRWVAREERTAIHRLTAEPPRVDRIERWRRGMTDAELCAFERIAGETLETFGYRLSTSRDAPSRCSPDAPTHL